MPIDPRVFEQFFMRNSSGDWVYVGYGPGVYGRIVTMSDMDWLMDALPKLSRMKRWTVVLFSAPLTWLVAVVLNVVAYAPMSPEAGWIRERFPLIATAAIVLLLLFCAGSVWLSMTPLAREFGRLIARLPRDEALGIERFLRNVGAVNGAVVTTLLMGGFGVLVVPGAFRADTWPFFVPFTGAWLWLAGNVWIGAFWRPGPEED